MSAGVRTPPSGLSTGLLDAVIASLPVSLHASAEDVRADFVAVDGGPGWPVDLVDVVRASGARGAVVIDPVAETSIPTGVPVVVDRTFSSHPAVSDATALAAAIGPEALIEVRIEAPLDRAVARALLDGLALARTISAASVAEGRVLVRTEHALSARIRFSDGRPGIVSVVRTGAREHSASARILSPDTALTIDVPAPVTARPASVVRSTAAGEMRLPLRFESAHRYSWRRLLEQSDPDRDLIGADADTRALHLLLDPA